MRILCGILFGVASVAASGEGAAALAAVAERANGGVSAWPVLKTYTGAALRQVKMPLGGLGTGTISLSGRGGLVDWEVQNRPAKGFTPATSNWTPVFHPSFVLRWETADGQKAARLLEGPLFPDEFDGALGCRAPNAGFPRFAKAVFQAAYPLAQVALTDPNVPVEARLEAMNPLVPGDADASGLPAVLLRWRLKNTTGSPLKVSVAATLVNFAGVVPGEAPNDRVAARHEAACSADELTGVVLAGKNRLFPLHPSDGECALLAPRTAGSVTTATDLREPGWGVAMDRAWSRLVAQGDVGDTPKSDSTATCPTHLAQVCVAIELKPGEERSVPFVLAWRFPNRLRWHADLQNPKPEDRIGNWYATRHPTAAAAAARLWQSLPELEAATVAFVKDVLETSAPAVVKEAALFNLPALRSETCFRTPDGHFFGWEGCMDREGSCFGSCTHVWGYEHCLVDLWPELARSMLDNAFGPQLRPNGHMRFRVELPLAANTNGLGVACADGQMQTIVKAYEYGRKTGDRDWLRKTGPAIRRALAFAWIEGGWDADRDGVMEGCQHNTMDVEYYGPNPQMEFLYLAALKASAEMADACGEREFAADCRALAARGAAWTERNLFNGRYYEHRIVPPKGKVADGLRDPTMGAKDLTNPDFQLGAGCLVDQLVGDFAARAVGLGPVADPAHARTTLATILEKCRKAPNDATFNPMRSYALAGETSLRMAWYPPGRLPRSPFPYYRETMTGFEYVVAALLAQAGDWAAAERVVADIRARYDGVKRNPFDEAECGHHYVRALASWSVLKAWRPLVAHACRAAAPPTTKRHSREIARGAIEATRTASGLMPAASSAAARASSPSGASRPRRHERRARRGHENCPLVRRSTKRLRISARTMNLHKRPIGLTVEAQAGSHSLTRRHGATEFRHGLVIGWRERLFEPFSVPHPSSDRLRGSRRSGDTTLRVKLSLLRPPHVGLCKGLRSLKRRGGCISLSCFDGRLSRVRVRPKAGVRAASAARLPEGLAGACRRRIKPSGLGCGDGSAQSLAVRRARGRCVSWSRDSARTAARSST